LLLTFFRGVVPVSISPISKIFNHFQDLGTLKSSSVFSFFIFNASSANLDIFFLRHSSVNFPSNAALRTAYR